MRWLQLFMTRYSYSIILSLLITLTFDVDAQNQSSFRFVGQINGVSKDSFQKNDIDVYPSIPLPKLTQSVYDIEIRLYETDFPMGLTYCTIIYLDTILKRKGFMNVTWEKGNPSKMKPVSFSNSFNVDSIFAILIENGIFSLEDIDPMLFDNKLPANYSPNNLTKQGNIEKVPTISVRDGVYYLLEFKVGDLFNSHSSFINPESFHRYYHDNQILRRQSEISLAMTCGRQ
jgi:hypothetical protein